MRQAEGYLELIFSVEHDWPLPLEVRDRLANRCLERLDECEGVSRSQGHLYYLRGEAFRTMERFEEAIAPFEKALDYDAENIHTYLALGWCYKRLNRLDDAIQALEQAVAVDFGVAILHYNLACYWALKNKAVTAVSYLSTAFDIDGSYRDLVADESDFDPIRDDPDFLALTTVNV